MDERIALMERELTEIKQRNQKVEADKAWETSRCRIALIGVITYVVAAMSLYVINADRFWLGAFIPVVGYVTSTRSLPDVKRWWIAHYLKKEPS